MSVCAELYVRENKLELKDDTKTLTSHDGSRAEGDQHLQKEINTCRKGSTPAGRDQHLEEEINS